MRASHLYLSSASHLHFSFHLSLVHLTSSPLNLSFASLIAPLTSTSDLHLLQHLSIASLSIMCATQLHISVAHPSGKWHLSFGPLNFPFYSHLKVAHHICTSFAPLHPLDAPLFSQLCVKVLVEPRGRSCAAHSCEPETCCHLLVTLLFTWKNFRL